MTVIKATPTDGLCYNPSDARYWDQAGLAKEIDRVFDICHGCRMCFNLCPSFPALFDAVDRHDGDVRKLDESEKDRVVDACYQCKLCYVKCPYTADDGHEFNLDFPRLLLRYTAQRAKRRGVGTRGRVLGNPMLLGKLGASMPRLANRVNASALHRRFLQALLGVHRKKKLPEFAPRTFERWLGRRKSSARGDHEVVLFHTCFVNFYNPELGRDTVEVLERNGATVCSPAQTCCGMPAMETGNVELAREQVRANIRTLAPYAERGAKILAINPTCSYMLKKESVDLAGPDLAAQARKVAEATRDVCEHLFERKREERFDRAFKSSPGEVAYHVPCHLKAQNIGFRSRDMMRTIPDVSVRVVDRCCGHDGTWAMRTENFEASLAVGAPAFDEMKGGGFMTTDCPLAAVQFEQATGVRPIHPVQVLARAYRGDSFPSARPAASTETAE